MTIKPDQVSSSGYHATDCEKDYSTGTTDPKTIVNLNLHYMTGRGKVILDPEEAVTEFGVELACQLRLDDTGTIVLWPQPGDEPDDPQTWSPNRKLKLLVILTMASFVPDFMGAIGIAALFGLAQEFKTTPTVINNVTSNWSIFLMGPGGLLAVILAKRYGRLPVLFWSQLLGLGFLLGCAVAPTLNSFGAMRCLNAFFSTAPQVMGLYVVNDLYPFHLQARMLNFWTSGFLISPFVSPWLFGYLTAKVSYRWAYWIGCLYTAIVVIIIVLFMEETIYDRFLSTKPVRSPGLRARIEDLVGLTGLRAARHRETWSQAIWPMVYLLTRPHLIAILLYTAVVFGFAIGINVTNVVFVRSPPPLGYGLNQVDTSSLYVTPVVAVILGELIGRYMNDYISTRLTRRNHGVFEPEMRLWSLHVGLPFFVVGMVLLGAAFKHKLHLAVLVLGWGLAEIGIMISTVACFNYANNAFAFPGEIGALLSLARVMGGFAIPYFQTDWANARGALETFGCEAAITTGLFLLTIPLLQIKGPQLRKRFALYPSFSSVPGYKYRIEEAVKPPS